MNKSLLQITSIAVFFLVFSACSIEPDTEKLPIIEPSIGFSVYQESITLNDVDIITGDSSITKESYGGSDSIFVFNKTVNIDRQEVGDKLSIDDIIIDVKDENIMIEVEAKSFLHSQVRIMVGTLVDIAKGNIKKTILEIINSKNREFAGQTAPPNGLYLKKIDY